MTMTTTIMTKEEVGKDESEGSQRYCHRSPERPQRRSGLSVRNFFEKLRERVGNQPRISPIQPSLRPIIARSFTAWLRLHASPFAVSTPT